MSRDGAHRVMDDRAFASEEFKGQPHAFEGQQQVGEDDGGIDVELLGGGNGDFGGELGLLADFEQGVVLAYGLILGHIAACLAQEPDRRTVDRAAQAGANEAGAGGQDRCVQRGVKAGFDQRCGGNSCHLFGQCHL